MLRKVVYETRRFSRNCTTMLNGSFKMDDGKCSYNEIVRILDKVCPASLAESWDNTGLLLEPYSCNDNVESVFLTNDLTEAVLSEAIALNTKFIISYHPPLFVPFKNILQNDWKQRIVTKCLANQIAIYSPHTRFDSMKHGINDWLASAFDGNDYEIHPINPNEKNPNVGEGRICTLKNPLAVDDVVQLVKTHLKLEYVQLALGSGKSKDSKIKTIAICAGSGAPLLKTTKADLYLTGEMKHHDLLDAIHVGTTVILCGHCNSERGFLTVFADFLRKLYPDLKVFISKIDSSPFSIV